MKIEYKILYFLFFCLLLNLLSCSSKQERTEKYLQHFINRHTKDIEQIYVKRNLAYWDANVSGESKDFKKYEELEQNLMEKIMNRQLYPNEDHIKHKARLGL